MQGKSDIENSSRRWWVLGVLVLSLLVVQLDTTILGVAVQRLSQPAPDGLGLTQGELLWAINAYTLVMAGMLLTTGALADRLGRKRVLLGGLALFGIASLWCAFSASGPMLIAGRAVLGLAAALVTPTTLAIITQVFSKEDRPRAIGIWSGGVGVAVAVGPIVGGLLLDHLWWGSIFLVNVPVVAVAVAAMAVIVPESRNPRPGRFDVPGVLLSLLGLALLVNGIIEGGDTGDWANPRVWLVALGGVLILVVFVAWECRAAAPLLPLDWFRSRTFTGSIAVMTLAFFAMLGVTFTIAFYLLSLRRLSVLNTGLLLLPLALAQLTLSAWTPAVARRFGARVTGGLGMLLLTTALLLFASFGIDTPLWIPGIALFLIGTGIAFIMPSASAAIMASVPKERAGSASATSTAFRQVGGALGTAALGAVLTGVYRAQIAGHLDAVPAALRDVAASSIQATQAILESVDRQLPEASAIAAASDEAFIAGFHASSVIGAAIALLGALLAALVLTPPPRPHADDSQIGGAATQHERFRP
ncbi:MFS transporter [Microbacterium sp. XT11]|uniref:MFS transporter n=1 Tax=Microbacterium sp. XT11 TaxID=367477 RepID=UPI00082F94AA|nr:MFS transporter [Microbacterium sp. XT11]